MSSFSNSVGSLCHLGVARHSQITHSFHILKYFSATEQTHDIVFRLKAILAVGPILGLKQLERKETTQI